MGKILYTKLPAVLTQVHSQETSKTGEWCRNDNQYVIICSPGRPDINVYADLNLALDDIQAFKATLKESTEEDLLFYWRVRHALQADKSRKYKARTMIWHEFMDKYQCSNKPIQIRLPYFEQMNIQRVRQ